MEQVRFLKTGAEAVLAAVRLARVHTGRDRVVTCGYHGWLDWCQSEPGVPAAVRSLHEHIPFNEIDQGVACLRRLGPRLAAVVIEPVIDGEPGVEWLARMRSETERLGAVLIFDEIKTAFRIALGGAAERYGIEPDLAVVGKALGNGFPLAAVGGRRDIMAGATKSWISSTLATEQVSLAAAKAVIGIMVTERVPERLGELGGRLHAGLMALAARHPTMISTVCGMPEMCYLEFRDPPSGYGVVRVAAAHGILWKRTAYNFVSSAHDPELIDRTLIVLEEALQAVRDDSRRKGGSC
jgi:glutamate-1-semialdehyde aminotransferase